MHQRYLNFNNQAYIYWVHEPFHLPLPLAMTVLQGVQIITAPGQEKEPKGEVSSSPWLAQAGQCHCLQTTARTQAASLFPQPPGAAQQEATPLRSYLNHVATCAFTGAMM